MTGPGWRGDSMVLVRARVPPSRDALRARRTLERALADVDWRTASLPTDAVLLVRRIAVPAHEPAADPAALGVRVGRELRRHAASARRPWLQGDAAAAAAVLFADEAEMLACLARDWLLGRVAAHWWWREILGGASPTQWLRTHAWQNGEMLAAVASRLAASGHAIAWVERLDPQDTYAAVAAIQRAYGLRIAEDAHVAVETDVTEAPSREGDAVLEPVRVARERAEIARLAAIVPEALSPSLALPQRRLLMLALGLARAPAWVRSIAFRWAWHAIGAPVPLARVPVVAVAEGKAPARAKLPAVPEVLPQENPSVREECVRRIVERATDFERFEAIEPAPQAPTASASRPPTPMSAAPRLERRVGPVEERAADEIAAAAFAPREAQPELPDPEAFDPVLPQTDEEVESPDVTPVSTREVAALRLPTAFGGIFYLLNAAIGMGIYADFTAPLAKNLELSPWDWVALIGREWFGRELVEDPAWRVLADLAGRTPEEEPDRDFHPPSDDWLREHLALLHTRLASALDAGEGADVPAFVCRHDAGIEVSATTVHVFLALAHLDLAIRIAGLDRDTGWIPAAGRAVRFHFD